MVCVIIQATCTRDGVTVVMVYPLERLTVTDDLLCDGRRRQGYRDNNRHTVTGRVGCVGASVVMVYPPRETTDAKTDWRVGKMAEGYRHITRRTDAPLSYQGFTRRRKMRLL